MISYIIPTRNRQGQLERTLEAIGRLGDHARAGGAEVVVIDNASRPAVWTPGWLKSGLPVRLLRRDRNEGAAARNAGAKAADPASDWLVMLDDDSYPLDAGVIEAVREAGPDTAAIAAEVFVPTGEAPGSTIGAGEGGGSRGPEDAWPTPTRHESGGLPEVFVGCGVAIRRGVFEGLGGYDARFDYYAEEYDLAARLLLGGHRVTMDRRFRVIHEKVAEGRDFGRIIRRLVRNNGWVVQRYAPAQVRQAELRETITRYARIARKEGVLPAYVLGVWDLVSTLSSQARTPMAPALYDRLTGMAAARVALSAAHAERPLERVAIVERGKNAWVVEAALRELGAMVVPEDRASTHVIGTMSPGPMLDALARRTALARAGGGGNGARVVVPWVEALRVPAAAQAVVQRESGTGRHVAAA
ncbi:MAG: glycosyltransferase [Phycisphaerae bacterium]|nr:glycosyltransferase [Phycisphaerae bacterium]